MYLKDDVKVAGRVQELKSLRSLKPVNPFRSVYALTPNLYSVPALSPVNVYVLLLLPLICATCSNDLLDVLYLYTV